MTVFRNYFKIVKKFIPLILLYTGIFMFFAVISTMTSGSTTNTDFVETKPKVSIINNDTNSLITNDFVKYVENNSEIIELESDENSLKDALFFRRVNYIMIIPEGFGESIINNKENNIEIMEVPGSYKAKYSEMLFNKYLNIVKVYSSLEMNENTIIENVNEDLYKDVEVKFSEKEKKEINNINYYYNFANYTILAINIFIIGLIMNIFNDKMIRKRNLSSPISYKSVNRQLFLSNSMLSFFVWIIYVLMSFILYPDQMATINGLLLMLNSFIFSIVALSIGFLIGTLIKSKEAQNGIVNVVALGSSFLCGAFVPQEFLSEFVLNIAKVLPSYWYINNNNYIVKLTDFDFDMLKPMITNMIIIALFSIVIFIVTNILTKLRLKKQ